MNSQILLMFLLGCLVLLIILFRFYRLNQKDKLTADLRAKMDELAPGKLLYIRLPGDRRASLYQVRRNNEDFMTFDEVVPDLQTENHYWVSRIIWMPRRKA